MVAILFAGLAVAGAGGKVQVAPGLSVPAECPLARNEHPRFLFTKKDLERIRARFEHPALVEELGEAVAASRHRYATPVLKAVLYQLTGEAKFAGMAKDSELFREGSWLWTYAAVLDMVYETLSTGELERQADVARKVIEENRWRYHLPLALVMWGSGRHDGFFAETIERYYDGPTEMSLVRSVRHFNEWAGSRGGSPCSFAYYGEHGLWEVLTAAFAWSNSTGEEWRERVNCARFAPAYFIYHYVPDPPLRTVHIGINRNCQAYPHHAECENFVPWIATKWQDGLAQWMVSDVIERRRPSWDPARFRWGKLLWHDPRLPAIPPEKFPPARFFDSVGYAVMRSDWSPRATFAHFQCGRFEPFDGGWGRNNADNLSFVIHKLGTLAADTGAVHALDGRLAKFDDPAAHFRNYARQTIAHNSITVGSDDVTTRGGTALRGGQVLIPPEEYYALWGVEYSPELAPAGRYGLAGRILAFETNPLFDYVAGEAACSYSPRKVESISRQFVFLRPGTFIVFDRVVARDPRDAKVWYLHALDEPLCPEGEIELAGGRSTMKGPTVVIDDLAGGNAGRLYCLTLLPEERVIRKIGGPGHEFEVAGRNWGPTEATYAEILPRLSSPAEYLRMNSTGVGGWRIEVQALARSRRDFFLHVLKAGERGTFVPPRTKLVRRDGLLGVELIERGESWLVLFRSGGEPGGTVKLARAGEVVLETPLADSIRDDYSQWVGDARYLEWMTSPYMRNVIGGREQDAFSQGLE